MTPLSEEQRWTLILALRVASETYTEDALTVAVFPTLVEHYEAQSKAATELADLLEECHGIGIVK